MHLVDMNSVLVKPSTRNGEPVTHPVFKNGQTVQVPSYVTAPGVSVVKGAAALGFRVLGRRDDESLAVAEIHERGGQSFLCAPKT